MVSPRKNGKESAELAYRMGLLFNRKITSFYWRSFKGELGQVQAQALSDLYENQPARTQEIADRLGIPKQHASKILSRLEETGLVESTADPSDKRSHLYVLSEKGSSLVQDHIASSNDHFLKMIESVGDGEQQRFNDAMEIMVSFLNKL